MNTNGSRGSSLCAALRIYADYELLCAKEIFRQLSDDCSYRLHANGTLHCRTDAVKAAERLISYINNYISNNEHSLLSETGIISLVAIDRARDHLVSALESVRSVGRCNYGPARVIQELRCRAARYTVNQLITVRSGDSHLAGLWRDAGDLCTLLAQVVRLSAEQTSCPEVEMPERLAEYDKSANGKHFGSLWKRVASCERRMWARETIVALLERFRQALPDSVAPALLRWHERCKASESKSLLFMLSLTVRADDLLAVVCQSGLNTMLGELFDRYFDSIGRIVDTNPELLLGSGLGYVDACSDVVHKIVALATMTHYLPPGHYRGEVEAAVQAIVNSSLFGAPIPADFEAEAARLLELIEALKRRKPAVLDMQATCRARLAAVDPTRSEAHAGTAKCLNKALEYFGNARAALLQEESEAGPVSNQTRSEAATGMAVQFVDLADGTYADAVRYSECAADHAAAGRTAVADLWRQASALVLRAAEDHYQRLAALPLDQAPVPLLGNSAPAVLLEMRALQCRHAAQAIERDAPEVEQRLHRALAELATVERPPPATHAEMIQEANLITVTTLLEEVLSMHAAASQHDALSRMLPTPERLDDLSLTGDADATTMSRSAASPHLPWISDTAARAAVAMARHITSGEESKHVLESLLAVFSLVRTMVKLIRGTSPTDWVATDAEVKQMMAAAEFALDTAETAVPMVDVPGGSALFQELKELRRLVSAWRIHDEDCTDHPDFAQFYLAVVSELTVEVAKQTGSTAAVKQVMSPYDHSVRGAVAGYVKKADCLQRAAEAAAQGRTEEERLLKLAAAQYQRHIKCHFAYVRFLARKGPKSSKKTPLIQEALRGTLVACDLYLEAVDLLGQGRVEASQMLARAAHYAEMSSYHADSFFRVSAESLAHSHEVVSRRQRTTEYFKRAARAFQQLNSEEAEDEGRGKGRKRPREVESQGAQGQALGQAWRAAAEASEKWVRWYNHFDDDDLFTFATVEVSEWLREHTLWLVRAARALEEGRADEAEACTEMAAEYANLERVRVGPKKWGKGIEEEYGEEEREGKKDGQEKVEDAEALVAAAEARIEELRGCPALRGKKFPDSL